MDEKDVYAYQFKERYDLNEQQANKWGKFLKRKEDYTQRYGAHYAGILLKKEQEALEAENNKAHQELDQQHDQQWLDYHNGDPLPKTYNLPEYLREREPQRSPVENKEKDLTDRAATILEQYQHTERISETLFPNPFKKNMEQEKTVRSETRDLDQSQSFMNSLLSARQKNTEKDQSEKAEITPVSLSTRFSQSLVYTKSVDKVDTPSEPKKDVDRE